MPNSTIEKHVHKLVKKGIINAYISQSDLIHIYTALCGKIHHNRIKPFIVNQDTEHAHLLGTRREETEADFMIYCLKRLNLQVWPPDGMSREDINLMRNYHCHYNNIHVVRELVKRGKWNDYQDFAQKMCISTESSQANEYINTAGIYNSYLQMLDDEYVPETYTVFQECRFIIDRYRALSSEETPSLSWKTAADIADMKHIACVKYPQLFTLADTVIFDVIISNYEKLCQNRSTLEDSISELVTRKFCEDEGLIYSEAFKGMDYATLMAIALSENAYLVRRHIFVYPAFLAKTTNSQQLWTRTHFQNKHRINDNDIYQVVNSGGIEPCELFQVEREYIDKFIKALPMYPTLHSTALRLMVMADFNEGLYQALQKTHNEFKVQRWLCKKFDHPSMHKEHIMLLPGNEVKVYKYIDIIDEVHDEDLCDNMDASPDKVFKRAAKRLELMYMVDAGKNIELPKCPIGEDPKNNIKQLKTSQAILDEGRMMKHCVGGYIKSCLQETSYIYHIAHDGHSTAEIMKQKDEWVVAQHHSEHDNVASEKNQKLLFLFIDKANKFK